MSVAPSTFPGIISLLLGGFAMTVTSIAYTVFSIYVITATTVSLILKVLFLPFTAVASMASIFGGGSSVSPLEAGSSLPAASMGLETLLLQFSDFIQGVFAGQLVAGSVFTNFMLITILGFISMKMFISFSLYETKLVPTR